MSKTRKVFLNGKILTKMADFWQKKQKSPIVARKNLERKTFPEARCLFFSERAPLDLRERFWEKYWVNLLFVSFDRKMQFWEFFRHFCYLPGYLVLLSGFCGNFRRFWSDFFAKKMANFRSHKGVLPTFVHFCCPFLAFSAILVSKTTF